MNAFATRSAIDEASDTTIEKLIKAISKPAKPHYAGGVAIRKAVKAAREASLDVAGLELGRDGTIRIFDPRVAEWIASKDIHRTAPSAQSKG